MKSGSGGISIQFHSISSKLKFGTLLSLFKKGNLEMTSNDRPILLLSTFSKLHLMYDGLYSFITHNKIIHPMKFGSQKTNSIDQHD